MPQITRLRIGSGGSALSLAFAAGLAAAGGFAAATAPGFGAGGAGVLPSTGSAIFPLLDLSISIINRDYGRTNLPKTVYRYKFLYFRSTLPVKANSDSWSDLFAWFILWTARGVAANSRGKPFNTQGTENTEVGREMLGANAAATLLSFLYAPLCSLW